MSKQTAINRAVSMLGSRRQLADAIHVSDALVYQWTRGIRPVAARHCIPIESATDGAVTRYELCPDVFGAKPSKAA